MLLLNLNKAGWNLEFFITSTGYQTKAISFDAWTKLKIAPAPQSLSGWCQTPSIISTLAQCGRYSCWVGMSRTRLISNSTVSYFKLKERTLLSLPKIQVQEVWIEYPNTDANHFRLSNISHFAIHSSLTCSWWL